MSKNSTTRFFTNLFVLVVSVALVGADLVVLAQNENDTTRGGTMTSQNGNMSGGNTSTGTTRRRRRQRRRASANANTDTSTDASANVTGTVGDTTMSAGAGMQANTNTGGTGRRRRRGRRRATTDMSGDATATTTMGGMGTATANSGGEQTDLSGTYTGTVNYPEGGLSGAGTLTITGNSFTITPEGGGTPITGRVTAVTTRGYTGVTMMFGDTTAPPPTQNPPPPPLPTVSLQARRMGDRVTLKSVPGERRQFSFTAAGTATGGTGRRRARRRAKRTSGMGNMAHSNATL